MAERGTAATVDPAHPDGAAGPAARPGMPLFLPRDSYRRRRLMDAARLLPAFGAALVLLPVLWTSDHPNAHGAVYLFACWAGLIAATAALSRRLSAPTRAGPADAGPGDGGPGAGGRVRSGGP